MPDYDVMILGSGPAGVHSAQTLVEAGKTVCMIDGGNHAPAIMEGATVQNFEDMRRTQDDQYRWFLGENYSGIPLKGMQGGLGGGQISGNRGYAVKDTDTLLPLTVHNASVIQTLAQGGMGAVWGAACAYLPDEELQAMGLDAQEMQVHYDKVTERIGISGPPSRKGVQPALIPDLHATYMLERYKKNQSWFEAHAMNVTQPHSAILTESKGNRLATKYQDMEYWSDSGKSVYRPQWTLQELQKKENFYYLADQVAMHIDEQKTVATVHLRSRQDAGSTKNVSARRVILACGAVGSARLLLASRGLFDCPVSFIGKPHMFAACLHPSTIGKSGPKERTSLCQLLLIDQKKNIDALERSCTQFYSYRSLLLFRLLSSFPLPVPQAMNLLAALSPALVIADIRFPGRSLPVNSLSIHRRDQAVETSIQIAVPTDEMHERKQAYKSVHRGMQKIGLLPVRTFTLPEASTSHYAGTIPIAEPGSAPLTTNAEGKLHGSASIYIADASLFRCLSAKPHTLTIMANASRVADAVASSL